VGECENEHSHSHVSSHVGNWSPNFRTKCHLDVGLVERRKVYYKGGRLWLPPSLGRGESCEFEFARGLF
jgi:hypothetical protein